VVAPLVNVLILWIIPFIMLLGFFAVLVSFIFLPLAKIISWLAYVGLQYIIEVVKWFAGLDFAAVDFSVPWWGMVGGYVLLCFVMMRSNRTQIKQI